ARCFRDSRSKPSLGSTEFGAAKGSRHRPPRACNRGPGKQSAPSQAILARRGCMRPGTLIGGLFLTCVCCALLFYGQATADQPFTFVSLDYPGAISTELFGINNRGDVVGSYQNPENFFHGFVYQGGQFTSIDGPGAAFTQIKGINDSGDIVGTFITLQDIIAQ